MVKLEELGRKELLLVLNRYGKIYRVAEYYNVEVDVLLDKIKKAGIKRGVIWR